MKGIVIKATGSWYIVEELESGNIYNCRIRGKLRLDGLRTTNPVSVGDIVVFDLENCNDQNSNGVITSIDDRRNYIIRRSTNLSKESHIIAANVDNVFLVVTLDFPLTSTEFIDRFLISCEMYKVKATLILNKMDLFESDDFKEIIDEFKNIYISAGYNIIECSAINGKGIDEIKEMLKHNISLFSGNSGVGKSTLINAIAPQFDIKSAEISDYHKKGKHTTTFSQMYKLEDDTYIVDTPGIKGFGLINIDKYELARYMPDLFSYSSECGFYNCTHTHEPKCAIKDAVKEGNISGERYSSYLKIADDLTEGKYR